MISRFSCHAVHCREFRKDNSMHVIRVDEMSGNRVPRVGVGRPVGSGKTMLIERVVPILAR